MLKEIRKSLKTFVAMLFVLPLIVAFAAWGVPEVRQMTSNHAVRVGSEGFSALAVQREFDRFATSRRLSGEEEFDREAAIAQGVPAELVQSMAARSALDQEAGRMGLIVPRSAVKEFLQTSEQFKNPTTGKFDNDALTGIMREYNYGVAEFEDRLQSDLLRGQLFSAIGAGGAAPTALVAPLVLRETEKRTISMLTVTDDLAGAAAEPTPAALNAYYKENSAQFMAPEYRTFTTVVLKNADYAEGAAPSEAELRKSYEANKSRYETPERRTIHQLTFDDKAKADAAVAALKSGKPFENIASETGKTLAEATLTDSLKRDVLDPKVADAAFKAGVGEVVGPIEGVFGWTVAQVAAITPATVMPFEEARSELEQEQAAAGSKKQLFEAIEAIESARDTGAALADAAKTAGLRAVEYGPVDSYSFGKGGEIVADIPGEILKEAFEIEEGEESDELEFADKSGYYFIAVNEVAPPAVIPYERVASEVESKWRAEEKAARVDKIVKAIRDAVAKGKSLKEAATPYNRAPVTLTLGRQDGAQMLAEALLDQVFAAGKGETISGPAAGGAELVITVDDIAFEAGKVSPDDVTVFSQYVGNQLNQELAEAYATAVRDDLGVKINKAQMDTLFTDGQ